MADLLTTTSGAGLGGALTTGGGLSTSAVPAPTTAVTPGSQSSGSMMIGSAPPSVSTVKQTQTAAPSFYTDYLQSLANLGAQGVTGGGVAGLSGLQQQAYANAPTVAGAQDPYLAQASNLIKSSTQTAPTNVNAYMNPYTQNVVNEIGRLGQQQISESLAPQATAGAVGSGQFGSQRGAQVLGQTIRDANKNILGRQAEALQTGYQNAMTASQADMQRQLLGAQASGQLGSTASQTGIAGLGALSQLGAQQQAQEQAQLNYPMTAATQMSQLLKGYTMPTSATESYQGPMAGLSYSPAPLAQIAALLSASGTPLGKSATENLGNLVGKVTGSLGKLGGSAVQAIQSAITSGGTKEIPNSGFYDSSDPAYGWQFYDNGVSISPNGDYYQGNELVYSPTFYEDASNTGIDNWSDWFGGTGDYGNYGE